MAKTGRPALHLIIGGQEAFSTQTAACGAKEPGLDAPIVSARALLALASHAKSHRYWLIDPLPTICEIATGAPVTADRLGHLRLAAEALSRQVREDDPVGRTIIAALERDLGDAELTVADVIAALCASGDSEGALRLTEELRAQPTALIASLCL